MEAGRSKIVAREQAARQAGPWVERVARLGYIAKGVIYAVIGFLALREAVGAGGRSTDPSGAIHSIGTQPLGGVMLTLLAVGLACYALWKVVQGVKDPDGKGSDAHGIVRRVAYVGSGALYGLLAYTAAQSILGAEDSSEDAATASAMAFQPPLGPILVWLVGTIVVAVGLYQLYAAYEAKFRDDLRLQRMGETEERWVIYAGRIGTAARASPSVSPGPFSCWPRTSLTRAKLAASAPSSRPSSTNPSAPTCSVPSLSGSSSTAPLCSQSPATAA